MPGVSSGSSSTARFRQFIPVTTDRKASSHLLFFLNASSALFLNIALIVRSNSFVLGNGSSFTLIILKFS